MTYHCWKPTYPLQGTEMTEPMHYDFALTVQQALALKVLTDSFLEDHGERTSELVLQIKTLNTRVRRFLEEAKS